MHGLLLLAASRTADSSGTRARVGLYMAKTALETDEQRVRNIAQPQTNMIIAPGALQQSKHCVDGFRCLVGALAYRSEQNLL